MRLSSSQRGIRAFRWRALQHLRRRRLSTSTAASPMLTSWINNESVNPVVGMPQNDHDTRCFLNRNPATGDVICPVQVASESEIELAVASSRAAFERDWSGHSTLERGEILHELAARLERNAEDFAELEHEDTGVDIGQVRVNHIPYAIQTLRYYASLCISGFPSQGRILDTPHAGGHRDSFAYTRREPVGVCVGVGPWNYPLVSMAWKLAPALACGNTFIYKPSECTPVTALSFAGWTDDLLPPGVFQVLLGESTVAQALVRHREVAKVSLTGSPATGRSVFRHSADTLKRLTLELGGKSPLLVFADANMESAVQVAVEGNFVNNGEVCSNCTRVYVQREVLDIFIEQLKAQVKGIQLGPLIMPPRNPSDHFDRVMGYVTRAMGDQRVKLLLGGEGSCIDGGYFMSPTIFVCDSDEPEIVQSEVFGPVMTVLPFDSEEEAILRANSSPYGLAAGLMTTNVTRAHRVAKRLKAGNVWVNNWNVSPVELPFGPQKMSGFGQELGVEAINHYSEIKTVFIEMGQVDASSSSLPTKS